MAVFVYICRSLSCRVDRWKSFYLTSRTAADELENVIQKRGGSMTKKTFYSYLDEPLWGSHNKKFVGKTANVFQQPLDLTGICTWNARFEVSLNMPG